MELKIKELKNIKEILLCKVNFKIIGELKVDYITNQTRNISDIDEIELEINKEYINNATMKKTRNPDYDNIVNERLLCVDGEYYVIKEITENKLTKNKIVKAYGLEKKLEKINIVMSNVSIALLDSDEEDNIISFNDELYKSTGWKLGYVANSVRYMENGGYKVRMQEDTNTSFYNFITETIADQFCCIPIFNRRNMTIDLYDDDSFGDELKVVLTKDNYVKDLQKTNNSSDIITRLKLSGNEEKCVVETVTPNGYDYIENYSYFIQTKEMSEELIDAIFLFEKVLPGRMKEWRELTSEKNDLSTKRSTLDAQETILVNMIEQYNALISAYESKETATTEYDLANIKSKLDMEKEKLADVSNQLTILSMQINELEKRISELNRLCRRETAEDFGGNLIFTNDLLNELRNFVYYDSYNDDSFYDAGELVKTGEKILERRCKPTIEWSLDSVNFLDRIIDKKYITPFNGELNLGDVIAFYDKETDIEEYAYFTSWTKNYKDKTLTLGISNKKTNYDSSKTISDLLKVSSNNDKILRNAKHIINNQKFNRSPYEGDYDNNRKIDIEIPPIIDKKVITDITFPTPFVNIDKDEEYLLVPDIEPENAIEEPLYWITSDKNVATVSNDGLIRGVNTGKCIISVTTVDGRCSCSCVCTVGEPDVKEDVNVTGISLNRSVMDLNIKGARYLVPNVLPANATVKRVTFTTTDENIAKVDDSGYVTGVSEGNCKITVISTQNPTVKAECIVNVKGQVEDIEVYNLDKAFMLGNNRLKNMVVYNLLDQSIVSAKDNVDGSGFTDAVNNIYTSLCSCGILMLGMPNISAISIQNYQSLIAKVVNKYSSKKVFIIQELPVGLEYNSCVEYNQEIIKFNNEIKSYAESMGAVVINVEDTLVKGGLLQSEYTGNGFDLNGMGCKILYNNIINNIIAEERKKPGEDPTPNPNPDPDPTPTPDPTPVNKKVNIIEDETGNNAKRNAIVDRAKEVLKLCQDGKAWYSQAYRTTDWNYKRKITGGEYCGKWRDHANDIGKYGFDCSSLAGVCYQAAGYDFMKALSCAGGTLLSTARAHNAIAWRYIDDTNLDKAKPGDLVVWANDDYSMSGKHTSSQCLNIKIHHVAVYVGNGYIIEASDFTYGIRTTNRRWFEVSGSVQKKDKIVFFRIDELVQEDKKNVTSTIIKGTTNAIQYVTADSLNVRKGRGTTYDIIGSLPNGTQVTIKEVRNGWAELTFEGQTAYVSFAYLSETNPNPTPTPTPTPDPVGDKPSKLSSPLWGIDVSYHNGTIDFQKVKNAGVKFVILRCGYASSSNRNSLVKDTKFETYYKDCKAVGLPVGTYFYSRCNSVSTGQAEAEFILKTIKGKQFEYPVWLDVEDNNNTLKPAGKTAMTNAVVKCMTEIKNAGYRVGIYTGKEQLTSYLKDESPLKDFDYWIASWTNTCVYSGTHYMWQFGGEVNKLKSTYVPGIGSDVADQNYVYVDYPTFIKAKGLNGYTATSTPTPTPTPDPTPDPTPTPSQQEGVNCYNESGTKDGNKYVYKFTKARLTSYGGDKGVASGVPIKHGYQCACHNMPYGTKIYIPALKGKSWNPSGIYTCVDTGGYCFDFDLFLAKTGKAASDLYGGGYEDVYVLSWGTSRVASSFTDGVLVCKKYYDLKDFHTAWKNYMKNGGCTINFFKYDSTDKTFKNQSWYNSL